jgi:hypothetical protein
MQSSACPRPSPSSLLSPSVIFYPHLLQVAEEFGLRGSCGRYRRSLAGVTVTSTDPADRKRKATLLQSSRNLQHHHWLRAGAGEGMWSHGERRPWDGSTDERTGGENNKSAILERQSFVRQRLSRPQRPPWPAPQSPSSCSIASHQSARSRRPPTTASPPTGGCSRAPTPGWPRTATLGHVFVAGDQGPHGDSGRL